MPIAKLKPAPREEIVIARQMHQALVLHFLEGLTQAHDLLKAWLKGDGALPPTLAEGFPELSLFEPARAHPARHPSILLAFEATAAAAAEKIVDFLGLERFAFEPLVVPEQEQGQESVPVAVLSLPALEAAQPARARECEPALAF